MHAAGAGPAPAPRRLDAVLTTYATGRAGQPPSDWALVYEPVDPRSTPTGSPTGRLYRDQMAELLRLGMDAGELPVHDDPELLAAAVVGGIAEALAGPLSPVAEEADEQHVASTIVALALRTVGAPT